VIFVQARSMWSRLVAKGVISYQNLNSPSSGNGAVINVPACEITSPSYSSKDTSTPLIFRGPGITFGLTQVRPHWNWVDLLLCKSPKQA